MKIIIDLVHSKHFRENGYIQFEGLFNNLDPLNQAIDPIVNEKKIVHDLWRMRSDFNKILNQRRLAHLASELTQQKPLRLGYDQYLAGEAPYKAGLTLAEISSVQQVICGALLCLSSGESETSDVFPLNAGDCTLFDPSWPLPWDEMPKDQTFLLIVYVDDRAVYYRQENDPLKHTLQKYGYAYGDRLIDKWNPIVYS